MNRCSLFWGEIQVVLKVCDKAALMEMGWTEQPGQPNVQKQAEPVKPEPKESTDKGLDDCEDKDQIRSFLESRNIHIDYRGSLETVKSKAIEAWKQQAQ